MEDAKTAHPRPATLPELLALDAQRRVVGIADGLVPLEALKPQSWDFSAPTLVTDDTTTYQERAICPSSEAFAAEFYKAYPVLDGVPLDGMLVAGSAVGQFLPRVGSRTRAWSASDVDLFPYGHESTDASRVRLMRFVDDLETAFHRRAQDKIVLDLTMRVDAWKKETRLAKRGSSEAANDFSTLLEAAQAPDAFERVDDRMVLRRPAACEPAEWDRLMRAGATTSYSLPHMEVVRTSGSVTITVQRTKIQVIFRHYATASEILHGFDIGASACGFDGTRVVLTELGRFAYEYGYNVVDTTRRSLTYEARLEKYIRRGFDLILPELNMAALPRRNLKFGYAEVVDLPRMPFAYKREDGNRVFVDRFVKTFGASSDYDLSEEVECGGFALAYMNLFRLVNGSAGDAGDHTNNFIYSAEGYGFDPAREVLTKAPHLTLKMLQRLYDQFRQSCWDGSRLNTRTLERYVPTTPLRDITKKVYVDGREMSDVLDEAFTAQRAAATAAWNREIRDADHSVLPWVTENPGGQKGPLTGSLNPIMEDPTAWYGEYYAGSPASL